MKNIRVFTDGACSGNPGAGGWGVVIVSGNDIQKFNGFESDTTNNRMELKAAIEGIKQSSRESNITLYTDSKYVKNGITDWIKNWKKNNWMTSSKKPVKNKDLWKELDLLNDSSLVSWEWVKAHQENDSEEYIYNNLADSLARDAIV